MSRTAFVANWLRVQALDTPHLVGSPLLPLATDTHYTYSTYHLQALDTPGLTLALSLSPNPNPNPKP
eukprot:scaffold10972_cov46-Phaeocystis_antarctica.AAC.2